MSIVTILVLFLGKVSEFLIISYRLEIKVFLTIDEPWSVSIRNCTFDFDCILLPISSRNSVFA